MSKEYKTIKLRLDGKQTLSVPVDIKKNGRYITEDVDIIVSGINEVTCRGGKAIVFCEEDPRLKANASELVILPSANPQWNALLSVIPLQLLSYHMSLHRGYDPDFPRNLSKTLTVD